MGNKKEKMVKNVRGMFIVVAFVLFQISLISAGVGIKWDKESALINEGERTCLTYNVYNPWPEEEYITIELSDDSGELNSILTDQEAEEKLVPSNTPSEASIPIKFCFKAPQVYERDCWIGDSVICKQECKEEQKIYEGEVAAVSIPGLEGNVGSGGSASAMSVSAPLRIRINCNAHDRDYSLIYILLAVISLIVIGWTLFNKYRKPKVERDREKLKKLQEEIRNETRGK
jgi:hypothetical protein